MTTRAQSVSAPRPPGAAHVFARLIPALLAPPLALALAAPAASAPATAATGTSEGRVQNVTNGQYVKSAQVAVEGTALVTHTNQFGEYQLAGVPAGPAKLTVTHGGLDSQTARISIGAGQTAQQDFSLTRASAATDGAVRRDAFTVSAERETNATSIATNEQRFAPNIKNVVSVDAFGDRPADSLGDSVNMISRSAFEYARPQFSYRPYFNLNSQYRQLSPTPGPFNGDSWKILPGGEFNHVRPISRTLGFIVNDLVSNQFNVQRRTIPGWTFNSGGTITNPYYRSFQLQDGPANGFRCSVSLKTDWKFGRARPSPSPSRSISTNFNSATGSSTLRPASIPSPTTRPSPGARSASAPSTPTTPSPPTSAPSLSKTTTRGASIRTARWASSTIASTAAIGKSTPA